MTVYSVLDVTPTQQDWIPDYIKAANRLVDKHGGKYLARTTHHELLEGQGGDATLRIIIEWPSKEEAIAFMNEAEYAPHLRARTEGSISNHYLIEGNDDLAN